jgi:predicted TIM-barrel enzyme
MNRIREVFGVSRVVLPVVHPVSAADAMASVAVAHAAGVKGVFTINQGMSSAEVLQLVLEIRRKYPSLWVGVNLLGHSPAEMLADGLAACDGRIDGLWSDNAHIDERAVEQPRAAEFVTTRRDWRGLYFGGVAFKYQRDVPAAELGRATKLASTYMDVVCTSGPGTGYAADPAKVVAMRAGVGPEVAIALASGVTAENVHEYLPYVDAYLVGTGIEARLGVLDPDKLNPLVAAVAKGSH